MCLNIRAWKFVCEGGELCARAFYNFRELCRWLTFPPPHAIPPLCFVLERDKPSLFPCPSSRPRMQRNVAIPLPLAGLASSWDTA